MVARLDVDLGGDPLALVDGVVDQCHGEVPEQPRGVRSVRLRNRDGVLFVVAVRRRRHGTAAAIVVTPVFVWMFGVIGGSEPADFFGTVPSVLGAVAAAVFAVAVAVGAGLWLRYVRMHDSSEKHGTSGNQLSPDA